VQDTFEQFLDELHCLEDPDEPRYKHVARNFSAREVADLLAAGENLDTPDAHGLTLMEWAAIYNRLDIIKFLVAKGLRLRSALYCAEQNLEFWPEYAELVEYLRQQGSKRRPNT
jgi:ankyrin repeat protein